MPYALSRRSIPHDAIETVWHAPDGHAIRRIDWAGKGDGFTAKPRGSLLFMPGRADFYEKYLEVLSYWAAQGWQVTAADWRGQGGSGRLGDDAVTGHIDDFGTWVGDLAAFWRQWQAETPAPHVLMGHSMGGHLVLRAAAEHKVDPAAMVLSSPMLGFASRFVPLWVTQAAAWLMGRISDPRRPAWKWSEKPGVPPASRMALLTHDKARYADELFWRDARPELVMGPGSWGWVEQASSSMRLLQRAGALEQMAMPVLIMGSRADRLVSPPAMIRAAARLRRGELRIFGPEAGHEILREADPVRDIAISAIDLFLNRAAPARE